MSKENNPNFHAAGFAVDILSSYFIRLRGDANDTNCPDIRDELLEFVMSIADKVEQHVDNKQLESIWRVGDRLMYTDEHGHYAGSVIRFIGIEQLEVAFDDGHTGVLRCKNPNLRKISSDAKEEVKNGAKS